MVDDGELGQVRDCLKAEGVAFTSLRGSAIPKDVTPPLDLFVCTARRADLVRKWPGVSGAAPWPLRIAVVQEDSVRLRASLRELGFHYLVRSTVHPEALSLFLRSSLHSGVERRTEPRVPVDFEVTVRSRLRNRSARLIDLSAGGCSILSGYQLRTGTVISVVLRDTGREDGEQELVLPARVMNSAPWGNTGDGSFHSGLRFVRLGQMRTSQLRRMLQVVALQKPREQMAAAAQRRIKSQPLGPSGDRRRVERRRGERRRGPRSRYEKNIVASLPGALHRILIGRDLSAGGMRIAPHPDLSVGDPVRLAIYGDDDSDLVVVNAVVVRDGGTAGLALQFREVSKEVAMVLESIAGHLPPIEHLGSGESLSSGTIVSELLETAGSRNGQVH